MMIASYFEFMTQRRSPDESALDDLDEPGLQGMNGQPGIQRDQPAGVPAGHFDEPRVVDLLMSDRPGINSRIVSRGRRPEPMTLETGPLLEQRGRILGGHGIGGVSRIGGEPDEPKLGEGASGPAFLGLGGKPGVRLRVVLMVRPRQREQDIGVQQGGLHVASSASSSFARLLGMISAFGWTSKTGNPLLRAFCVEARNPRRASCDNTSPSDLPAACACARAASKTSSSKVTVV